MAEAYLNQLGQGQFAAESAGIEPGQLNPVVVEVMAEEGIDIAANTTNSVQEFIEAGRQYDYLITVCDEASAERCPVYPGAGIRRHIGFEDPSSLAGSAEERLQQTRKIRDQIKREIEAFIQSET